VSWLAVAPSPFRGWIRWVPRSWPGARRPNFDLVSRHIRWPDESAPADTPLPADAPRGPGLVYLPPLMTSRRAEARALRERLAQAGCGVVEQLLVEPAGEAVAGGELWIDPLDAWLAGGAAPEWAAAALAGTAGARISIAFPLVAGLTPAGEELAGWLAAAAGLAPAAVVGVPAELSPFDRRRIVEALGERSFDAVFHGHPPSEGDLARRVAALGLRTLPPRPPIATLPPRAARNRELAGALWEAAELALRLEGAEAESAALFAAARRLESTPLDVAALGREGNLTVVDWLTPPARAVVEPLIAGGPSERLAELRRRWRGEGAR